MKVGKRVYKYALDNFNEVMHTTLNPDGPGVVRIHLIPPKIENRDNIMPSVAIINGQDIIPVNVSWSILLVEFIKEVNKYDGKPLTDENIDSILEVACKNIRKVYPFLSKKRMRGDLLRIMNTFKEIAYGEQPKESIGVISMGEYAPYMDAPHRMDLMISSMACDGKWNCNQRCVHCYAAGQTLSEEKELSTSEWMKIIDVCRAQKIPQLTFTGGEPTMRDDLFELIDYARWFVTRLNTNGIKLTKDYCDKLRECSLDSIQITFYSNDAEVHNKLVGATQYENTVKGIENALEAGLSVSINTPLCTLNKDYVETLKFLHDKGVIYVTCSGLITTGNALTQESENLQLSQEEIKAVLSDAVDYCYANGMEISFTSPGWIEKAFFEKKAINTPTCGACLSNMAITPAGNVVPCQSWLSGKPLGNILTDPWEYIWQNDFCVDRRNYSAFMLGQCPLRRFNSANNSGESIDEK